MNYARWAAALTVTAGVAWSMASCGGGGGGGSTLVPGTGVDSVLTSVTSFGAPAGIQAGSIPAGADRAPVLTITNNTGGGSISLSINSTEPLTDIFVGVAGQASSYYDVNAGGNLSQGCPSPSSLTFPINITLASSATPITLVVGSHNTCDRNTQLATLLINPAATTSGATNSGATNSGATNSGVTSSGVTNSGVTTNGVTTSGVTNSGVATSGATTSGATTSGATTSGATTSGATTSGATNATNGSFGTSGATTSGAATSGATTSGATTSGATTSGATTSGATTSGATTSGATTSGATTSGATNSGSSGTLQPPPAPNFTTTGTTAGSR